MAAQDFIPVVDFQRVLSTEDLANCPQVLEIHSAFSQVGFVFLKNHGIKKQLVTCKLWVRGESEGAITWTFSACQCNRNIRPPK